MEKTLPPLIQALLAPRHDAGVPGVELVQTHISWLLLAGDYAYKIKKPVKLPFLDFSTLERRYRCCLDELRLNRRFSPDIYLDVVGIFNTPQAPQLEGAGTPIEYAVKMRRFDDSMRLDRVCARGQLGIAHLSDLADTLVSFHESAAVAPPSSPFGAAGAVLAPALDNLRELTGLLVGTDMPTRLAELKAWTENQFTLLAPLINARKRAGRVRECHGDLHLANMVLMDDHVRLFDCIEFNENLRWIDVASDMAFTYVDLLAHSQLGLANWFVNEVLSRSGDYEAALVLRFYAVYRALVRAKVAAMSAAHGHGDAPDALTYLALAERLMVPPKICLVITHGLSGCGKTHASGALLLNDPLACTLRLRSDVERKRLFGMRSTERSKATLAAGIYAPDAQVRTYDHLLAVSEMLLRAGWSVIVDATFLKHADRVMFRELAKDTGAVFSILAPQASLAQLRQRVQSRLAQGKDASEASLAVLERQAQTIEPLRVEEVLVSTGSPAG
jgi:aminoglycoside phosphotransferase family enzyme/predicted kinase